MLAIAVWCLILGNFNCSSTLSGPFTTQTGCEDYRTEAAKVTGVDGSGTFTVACFSTRQWIGMKGTMGQEQEDPIRGLGVVLGEQSFWVKGAT